jgi:hypothetical protein
MSASFPRPTHYTARCVNRAAGIEETIKEFPIGIQG